MEREMEMEKGRQKEKWIRWEEIFIHFLLYKTYCYIPIVTEEARWSDVVQEQLTSKSQRQSPRKGFLQIAHIIAITKIALVPFGSLGTINGIIITSREKQPYISFFSHQLDNFVHVRIYDMAICL